MPLILSGNVASATAATTYSVANSCRIEYGDSAKMQKTLGTNSSNYDTNFTVSAWFKLGGPTRIAATRGIWSAGPNDQNALDLTIKDTQYIAFQSIDSGSTEANITTNQVIRDPTAWYHLAVIVDTTQGVAANRVKMYLNGTQITSFSTETYPAEDYSYAFCLASGDYMRVAQPMQYPNNYWDGYLAEVVYCEGQTLAIGDLGEFDSDSPTIWKPKAPSGLTFGNNGMYLDFEDSGNLGDDESGNTNDLSETNVAAVDQMTDSPTNNFCVPNSVDNYYAASTFSEGNCKIVTNSSNYSFNTGTFGLTAGKWYFEADCATAAGSNKNLVGISAVPSDATTNYLGEDAYMWGYYGNNGNSITGGTSSSYGNSYTDDDIIGVAIDLDNNKLYFAKNNTWQDSGDPTSGATGTGALSITAVASTTSGVYFPAMGDFSSDSSTTWEANFGNSVAALTSAANDANGYGNFEYAPPSGYLAICTKNLGSDGG